MDKKKRDALEAAGFRVGDTGDFLGLTEEECSLVESRVADLIVVPDAPVSGQGVRLKKPRK